MLPGHGRLELASDPEQQVRRAVRCRQLRPDRQPVGADAEGPAGR
ncbi:hypothetical protein [Frankia sp. Cas3]|nr:hypothetical protein [Frankia sp. Cas3]